SPNLFPCSQPHSRSSPPIKAPGPTPPTGPSTSHPSVYPAPRHFHHNPHTSTLSPTTSPHYPANSTAPARPGSYAQPEDTYSSGPASTKHLLPSPADPDG